MTGQSGRAARLRRGALICFGGLVLAFQCFGTFGLRINVTPSLPVGLYRVTADLNAKLVEFCPPEPYAALTIERGYREAGNCRDGAAPLMKPIVATFGDDVELSPQGIAVNGALLPNTAPLASDTKGRALSPWRYGHSTVDAGTVWVASSYHARSFDSRYLGPIPSSLIRNHVKPLLTFR